MFGEAPQPILLNATFETRRRLRKGAGMFVDIFEVLGILLTLIA
jgi:hypothetical protein